MDTQDDFVGLEQALSVERFGTYMGWAAGDRNKAIQLYTLNTVLSESLYSPLQMLEVTLRNRINEVMRSVEGDMWFDNQAFQANSRQADMLEKARNDLAEKKQSYSASDLVAALTFGYWTAMVGREYEDLWQKTLRNIGRREDGKGLRRKDFAGPLAPIRTLRNRIAHHEPIIYWSLPKHYNAIVQLTGWLSPPAAEWCRTHSRFESIYPKDGITLDVQQMKARRP